ncbi:hypothetical protein CMV_018827 [Castanea mollissima]|uniref:Uncharacterized protein n=1 Tax=Castanea mollissima TaxID=60419 RepID=A0A8J4QZF5_9ROSI|nr:hypothetical protein CMV_018827 [Castanea mollissima]
MVFVSLSMDPSICRFVEDRLELLSPYMVLSSLSPFYNFFSYFETKIRVQRLDLPGRLVRAQQRYHFPCF